jgi:BirA family transcriptional regulator, biotin operon repressor / biotin---[acetyl-CoA-carboxylase] ligase
MDHDVGGAYADLDRPPLDAAALNRALVRAGSRWREVVVVDRVVSTNAELAARARAGRAGGDVVLVAEHQTGGRGRLNRSWDSPPRAGLTVSALLEPAGIPAQHWPWLPLLTGVAVVEAVRRVGEVAATLKWPNDVLVDGRKLAGILSERIETPDSSLLLVGVGLNVTLRRDEVAVPGATSLLLEGAATTDRTVVLRELLRVLDSLFAAWTRAGGDPRAGLADSYARRCATLGRRVRAYLPDATVVEGTALRVDDTGRLVVRTGSDETPVGAGDVVHVR